MPDQIDNSKHTGRSAPCLGCPACKPTDLMRANDIGALDDDFPPELPSVSISNIGQAARSAGSPPGPRDMAAKAHSTPEPSVFNEQRWSISANGAGKQESPAYSQGGVGAAITQTGGASPTPQFPRSVSTDGRSVAVPAQATPKLESKHTLANSPPPPQQQQQLPARTTVNFTTSQPNQSSNQSFTASGAAVSSVAQTTTAQARNEVATDTRHALHRTSPRHEPQPPTSVAPRSELRDVAPQRVTEAMGVVQRLAPESAGREKVRDRMSVGEVLGPPQRNENSAAERGVPGRLLKERAEGTEKLVETTPRRDSSTLQHEATKGGAIRGDRMPNDTVPREGTRLLSVRSEEARGDAVRGTTPRVATTRTEPARTSSAGVGRFMGWASDRVSSALTPTASTSNDTMWRQQRSEPAQLQRFQAAPGRATPEKRGLVADSALKSAQSAPARSSAERPKAGATPLSKAVSVPGARPQPAGASGAQRSPHSMAGAPLSADRRHASGTGEVSSVPQSRGNRSEAGITQRVKQRYDVRVHRRELKESRIQRDSNRGDRPVDRTSKPVRVDSAMKRGESATRSADNRRSTERSTVLARDNQRSGPRSREALQARSAALRQAIFERINRIVTSAQRLRRSNSTALASMQQLDLATRIMEALGDEDYEGISELRSRERGVVASVRVFRRRKDLKNLELKQQKPRLKSLKALKKQRAARASGQGGAASAGMTQAGTAGIATGASAAPGAATGKIVSASRSGPSKSLDIFQAKSDDDGFRGDREG
jgi:hypothetical protein